MRYAVPKSRASSESLYFFPRDIASHPSTIESNFYY